MSDMLNTRADALLAALEASSGKTLRAMIEISDRCNEVCVHCYQVQGKKGEMTTAQVKAVMDELAELGILILTISGGEATLRPDFLELIEHARKRSFAVRLFTNGLTMTRELAAELKRLAVQVVEISLYSHRAEVHDFVTGVPGSFERTVAGIRHLVELGVDVHVKSPLMRVNQVEIDQLRELAQGLGASFSMDPSPLMPTEYGEREPERFSRTQQAYDAALQLAPVAKTHPVGAMPAPTGDSLCGAGSSVHVEANGELRPCTMLDLPLGDALQGVGQARTHNETFQALRALRWRDAHGCRRCDLAGSCARCFAAARAEVGDALAPYPSACQNARSLYQWRTGIAPEISAAVGGRTNVELGPYRHIEGSRFETSDDDVSAQDDALAAQLGWVRRRAGAVPDASVIPGQLIQLRRPGRKQATTVRAPQEAAASPAQTSEHIASDIGSAGTPSGVDFVTSSNPRPAA